MFDFGVDLTRARARSGRSIWRDCAKRASSDLDILDLIHAVAIFGWANRLMHTLGEAHRKA